MRAYELCIGYVVNGDKVISADIHERNEWLTVHVVFDSGAVKDYSFYDQVKVD